MPLSIHELKPRAKHGPRMSRPMRAEFVAIQFDSPPRQLSPKVAAKLKVELMRLVGNRQSAKFVEAMFKRYPELRGA